MELTDVVRGVLLGKVQYGLTHNVADVAVSPVDLKALLDAEDDARTRSIGLVERNRSLRWSNAALMTQNRALERQVRDLQAAAERTGDVGQLFSFQKFQIQQSIDAAARDLRRVADGLAGLAQLQVDTERNVLAAPAPELVSQDLRALAPMDI